jgi:dTMP kinase
LVNLSQGVLIAFEGIDGSGKTTQIKKVATFLEKRSYKVKVTHQPNHNSPYARLIKDKVKKKREEVTPEEELDWYTKDRAWDLEHNILPYLKKKQLVLVDRYYMSSAAYQGALNAFTLNFVLEKNSFARKPDLWLILDVSVPLGQSRLRERKKKNEAQDKLEIPVYQEKVLENYKKLAKMDIGGKVEWIDASTDEDSLTQTIGAVILTFLKQYESNESN